MQILLHTDICFAHVFFYIHACSFTGAFNHTCFDTEIFFYIETPLHRDAFAQGCFHTQSRTEIIFYTLIRLQRDAFTLNNFTHRGPNKNMRFYKGMHLHWELLPDGHFYTDILLRDFR